MVVLWCLFFCCSFSDSFVDYLKGKKGSVWKDLKRARQNLLVLQLLNRKILEPFRMELSL